MLVLQSRLLHYTGVGTGKLQQLGMHGSIMYCSLQVKNILFTFQYENAVFFIADVADKRDLLYEKL